MSFKQCTIAVLMGICLLISNAQYESDDSDDWSERNRRKGYVLKCFKIKLKDISERTPRDTLYGWFFERHNKEDICQELRKAWSTKGCMNGAPVGLLMLGLFLGVMITAVLCVCCPSVHAKASSITDKIKPVRCNLKDEEISNAKESNSRALPSVPLPFLPADIRSTSTTAQKAESVRPDSQHIYSESMELPDGSTNSAEPKRALATSPTYGYNKLANDVIPGASSSTVAGSAYQPLNDGRRQSSTYNKIPAVRDDGDLRSQEQSDPGGAHQYFVLEKKDVAMDSTETGHRDNDSSVPHDYFVLEKK